MIDHAHVLPVPGPVWGQAPMRAADDRAPPWRRPRWGSALGQCRRVADAAAAHRGAWAACNVPQRAAALQALRRQLRQRGLEPDTMAQALGLVAGCAAQTLGLSARSTQLLAAAALLSGHMAEMATGEGKTLAIGLAAAVGALAGIPVHVFTANPYLAARDAATLGPLFAALGLRATALAAASPSGCDPAVAAAARRTAYAHDVVYATAKDLAFDFLREGLHGGARNEAAGLAAALVGDAAPAPLMRGLCMALLDEADSILLDEAEVPLILSRATPQAARRAFLWQALALAKALRAETDFGVSPADRLVTLTDAGEEHLGTLAAGLGGPWRRPRYRREAVLLALAALHVYQRDQHYVVNDGAIELLDDVTGRIAVGRVWSRGLHTLVAIKEGQRPPPETETIAQTTFQRFFLRYWRLAGISGTLWEARGELRSVYGACVVRVPLHRPSRRIDQAPRLFADADSLFGSLADEVARLRAAGRPVLVGTDSVADSQRLSALLQQRGIAHALLNALQHAHEAEVVAAAGRAGRVTVATRMAGRGTDIELDDAARATGGLHVISAQNNASRRIDRQLAGRAGRHGDPGSTQVWGLIRSGPPPGAVSGPSNPPSDRPRQADKGSPWKINLAHRARVRHWSLLRGWMQWRHERERAQRRRVLLEQDLHWEGRLAFAGRTD